MPARSGVSARGTFVICCQLTGGPWFYWTGIGVGKGRQKWRRDLHQACLFHRPENAAATIARLRTADAVVVDAACVVVDE